MSVQALLEAKGRFVPILSSDIKVSDVIDTLALDKASALVDTDDSQTGLGLITERDIARGLKTSGRNGVDKPEADLMTPFVHTCGAGPSVEDVLRERDHRQIHNVPMRRNGNLYSLINMLDFVKDRLSEIAAEANALKTYVAGQS